MPFNPLLRGDVPPCLLQGWGFHSFCHRHTSSGPCVSNVTALGSGTGEGHALRSKSIT